MKNLNSLLEILLKSNIDFVVIGGFAGVVHGASQVTKDLDICCLLSLENIEKLRGILKDLHPKHRMTASPKLSFMDHPQHVMGLNNVYLETDLGVLDVLGQVAPIGDFQRIKDSSIEIELLGHKCKVISLEDLIQVKESMTRNKDQTLLLELKTILSKLKP